MRFNPNMTLAAVACALSLGLSSCLVAAAAVAAGGVGYVLYEQNEKERDFQASIEATWEATLAALAEQGYGEYEDTPRSATEGQLEGEGWRVFVERHPEHFTRVRVRIGTFESGDNRRKAGLLLERIGAFVGEATGTEASATPSSETPAAPEAGKTYWAPAPRT